MATDAKLMEGITKSQNDYVWQDREIRFDSRPNTLACRKGEQIIGTPCGITVSNMLTVCRLYQ